MIRSAFLRKLSASLLALCMAVSASAVLAFADEEQPGDTTGLHEQQTDDETTGLHQDQPVYSLSVQATTDTEQCYVGDIFKVTLSAVNDGNTDLTNVEFLFEDSQVLTQETLAVGGNMEKTIKLRADEVDIGNGTVNVSFKAAELADPITRQLHVEVLPAPAEQEQAPAEQTDTPADKNPSTGGKLTAAAAVIAAAALCIFIRKRNKK
ncbi:MAG: hypothetical protein IKP47_07555 [Ruminococcus sp.]|nr:hypothetical protein [Ruminococcus sp.]